MNFIIPVSAVSRRSVVRFLSETKTGGSIPQLFYQVRMVGLEPTTSPLSVECSNQLSYIRMVCIIAKGAVFCLRKHCVFQCSTMRSMCIRERYMYMVLLVCSAVLFVFVSVSVYAAGPTVRITEILYNAEGLDEGKEYVEVVNVGPGKVDMTTVKFFERSGSGHAIRQGVGDTVLLPGDVAVIVENPNLFLQYYASFDGVLLDTSSFALLNAGATVSLERDGRLLHSVTYSSQDGAQGDNNALHIASDDTISAGELSPGKVSGIDVDTRAVTDVGVPVDTDVSVPRNEVADDVALVFDPAIVFLRFYDKVFGCTEERRRGRKDIVRIVEFR